ncbi:hypothetical protein KSP39_PZI010286 [Platanthera zijinensis]|uniref:Uncharacterized protein n=1 Tax=Platanthera zijinensis TaxID=2320716 RepID=A0AAP0G734_9ASPA
MCRSEIGGGTNDVKTKAVVVLDGKGCDRDIYGKRQEGVPSCFWKLHRRMIPTLGWHTAWEESLSIEAREAHAAVVTNPRTGRYSADTTSGDASVATAAVGDMIFISGGLRWHGPSALGAFGGGATIGGERHSEGCDIRRSATFAGMRHSPVVRHLSWAAIFVVSGDICRGRQHLSWTVPAPMASRDST